MSFYNTESLPNFVTRDPTVRLTAQTENNKRFALNISGNGEDAPENFIRLTDDYLSPSTPYRLSLVQQCNPSLFFETPRNTGAFDSTGTFIPGNKKTYYIHIPYGNQSSANPYFGPLDLSYDTQLWQAWKATFGFDKIPIGFSVGFETQVGLGTEIVLLVGTANDGGPLNFPYVRYNGFTYIPGINNVTITPGFSGRFPTIYTNIQNATIYTSLSDSDFATYYPKEFNTPAASLVGPEIRPPNAQI